MNGLLDLRCLADLPLPDDPALCYPPLAVRSSIDAARPVIDQIAEGDLLVHHPFDDYESTVVRFLREAAADPHVTTIKITLYRAGDPSAVVDALLAAARAGKKVAALIELKARFDEEHNVGWARALETAGAHVVYGFVGLKVHAKIALVVRREGSSAAALRARRHGELQHALRTAVHGSQPVLRVGGAHLRRRRPVQHAHGIVAPAGWAHARRSRRRRCNCSPPCSR